MASTDQLIRRLSHDAAPVARLPAPAWRVLAWLAWSIPYLAVIVLVMGLRADLPQKLTEPRYAVEQGAALATALAAAFAAFCATIPGRPGWILYAPLVPLAVWLGGLGQGCLTVWVGGDALVFESDWICLPSIALAGLFPAVLMALMIRRGAPLYPHIAVALGGLAAAALGNVALRLFHPTDASLMVLVWQVGSVAVLAALAGLAGPHLHRWRHG